MGKEEWNCCDPCLGLLWAGCLLRAQLHGEKRRRTAVASGGYRLVLCWKLLRLSFRQQTTTFNSVRWSDICSQDFSWTLGTGLWNKETQLHLYLKSLHRLIILTTSPYSVQILPQDYLYFWWGLHVRIKNFESWVLFQFWIDVYKK